MPDRNDNLGNTGRSDEEVNPDLGVDEDSGMSGSSTDSEESDLGSSTSGTSGDRSQGDESDSSSRSSGFGDENGGISNR